MIDMTRMANVVAHFATGKLTVKRPGPVQQANGRRVNGTTTPVLGIIGSVWPISGDDATVYPDGRRQNNSAQIFVLGALQIADDSIGQPGDIVTHLGVDYEIKHQENWTRGKFFVYTGQDINHP